MFGSARLLIFAIFGPFLNFYFFRVLLGLNPSFIRHFLQRFSLGGGEIRPPPPLFLVQIVL